MSSETVAPYICPVTDLSCLRYPFTALPDCGHAFSNRAISQVCFLTGELYHDTVLSLVGPSSDCKACQDY